MTGATIVVKELKIGEIADLDGKFTFQDLPEATYTLSIEYMGYLTQEKKLRVEKGKTSTVTIAMKAEPMSLSQAAASWPRMSASSN